MIVKGETANGPVKECAIDLIGKLWHTIDDIGVKLDSLEAQFEKAGVMAPKYIHGVEWKDAADMTPSKAIKRMKVNQPWSLPSIEHPVVLFSQNIRPPIVPACKDLCKPRTAVPQGQNYMAAMGTTVSSFLHKQNDGLAERLDWLNEQELICSHEVLTMLLHRRRRQSVARQMGLQSKAHHLFTPDAAMM
ncbi:hypothetical protein IFR05_017347 [Cadophora sp. M221]|nr:hypothetical protein IFR05_017347 [Cadophora sp. M221]